MTARTIGSLALIAIALTLVTPGSVGALSCSAWDSPEIEFEQADAVFSGWLIGWSPDGSNLHFRVSRAWKGVGSREVMLIHQDAAEVGSTEPLPGKHYVFALADASGQALYAPVCRGPRSVFTDFNGELKAFLAEQPALELSDRAPWPSMRQALMVGPAMHRLLPYVIFHYRDTLIWVVPMFAGLIIWRIWQGRSRRLAKPG